jgi:hypothetical protein
MKTLIITLLITIFICEVYPQNTDQINHERYWYYRDRLKYFVKIGSNEGESCIVSIRNIIGGEGGSVSEMLHYGDHTIFLGWYIGVLATKAFNVKWTEYR